MSDQKTGKPSPAELETLHLKAEGTMKGFSYVRPAITHKAKSSVLLGRGPFVRATVQVVKKDGGENNLHYHNNSDSFWMVLKGRARFYGPNDVVIGEYGPMEGTITPQYSRYWFKNIADEDMEILHVTAHGDTSGGSADRIDLETQRFAIGTSEKFDARKD